MEQVNALELLREAMQIEKDGIRFYNKAAKASVSKRAQEVFKHLAAEELNHLEKLELVYDNLAENNEWLVDLDLLDSNPKKMEDVVIFEKDIEVDDELDELSAVEHGIRAEEDSIRLYRTALGECDLNKERGCAIFKWLLDFEKEHLKTLKELRKELVSSN